MHSPFTRFFSKNTKTPVPPSYRSAEITDEKGKLIFKQENIEAPASWSDMAVKVVASKYFYGEKNTSQRESSIFLMADRVCSTITDWGVKDGYFSAEEGDVFGDELYNLVIDQYATFNSPVWFNVGLSRYANGNEKVAPGSAGYRYDASHPDRNVPCESRFANPQASACFIISVEDNMSSILDLAKKEAMLFKFGSGTGTDLSTIRSSKEKLSGGGVPSGPLSFLKIYDQVANVVKSGGVTRRAAKMNILRDEHPDIEEFIDCKQKEEKKAWALIDQGYDGNFNGDAYSSVSYQNENLSVRASDAFMRAAIAGQAWETKEVTTGKVSEVKNASTLLDKIALGTHICGDPGMQFDDAIQKWHTCKNSGRIAATNPCLTGDMLVCTNRGFMTMETLADYGAHYEGPLPFVISRDASGKAVYSQILKAWHTKTVTELVDVRTTSGLSIRCTPDHRFISNDGQEIEAKDLLPDQELSAISTYSFPSQLISETTIESDKVVAVDPITCQDGVKVYDLEVENTHNFSVRDPGSSSNLAVIVHNCSEYVFLDNTACNLASINLMKFMDKAGKFNIDAFRQAVKVMITAQDILVDNASYPTPEIAVNSHKYRTLGLGYANLGSLLMSCGLPYDSDQGRDLAAAITALMTATAYEQSAEIAAHLGSFEEYDKNEAPMNGVINMHLSECNRLALAQSKNDKINVTEIFVAATSAFNRARHCAMKCRDGYQLTSGPHTVTVPTSERSVGYRNAQISVLAPCGTISFMMDCDTTGVEPDIALVKYKVLAGGGMLKLVNSGVERALKNLGYTEEELKQIVKHIDKHETIEDVGDEKSGLKPEHLSIFDCSFKPKNGSRSISYKGHIKMMAACQPFISGAISKTINMPNAATPADIREAYIMAWKLGLKCVAIYRDGSKRSQPLNTSKVVDNTSKTSDLEREIERLKKEVEKLEQKAARPHRMRLPDTRKALTHKFNVGGHEGYLTVGLFDNGAPGELFVTMAKEGSTVGGLMDAIGTLTSIALQYKVPIETLSRKFAHTKFDPSGLTTNPEMRTATSVIDYIFRWMEQQFVTVKTVAPDDVTKTGSNGHPVTATIANVDRLTVSPLAVMPARSSLSSTVSHFQLDAPSCPRCGHMSVRNGACYKCINCGESLGCS